MVVQLHVSSNIVKNTPLGQQETKLFTLQISKIKKDHAIPKVLSNSSPNLCYLLNN